MASEMQLIILLTYISFNPIKNKLLHTLKSVGYNYSFIGTYWCFYFYHSDHFQLFLQYFEKDCVTYIFTWVQKP